MKEISVGSQVVLQCHVDDDETGYAFKAGSEGEVIVALGGNQFTVALDCSNGDPTDSGHFEVICSFGEIRLA